MENEMQVEAFSKKLWSAMRVFLFMLRKGVSKRKLSLHLNLLLRRSKLAGKSIGNIMFHHHAATTAPAEYEFSCSNTPAHHKFVMFKKKQPQQDRYEDQYEEEFMDMMMGQDDAVLAGFERFRSPRVTDSPFPVFSGRVKNGDCHVDEAADQFIMKFYGQLRRQALTDG